MTADARFAEKTLPKQKNMSAQPRAITGLTTRSAIRRKSVGKRQTASSFSLRSIDLACQDFFKDRGLPVYGQFATPIPSKS